MNKLVQLGCDDDCGFIFELVQNILFLTSDVIYVMLSKLSNNKTLIRRDIF